MKKLKGFSSTGITIAIIAVLFIVIAGIVIANALNAIHYEDYDTNSIIAATKDNGYISDHVKGNPDAPVIIIEYADYECPLCAATNPKINQAIEESNGQLAVIYRSYIATYHPNSTLATPAAESAGLQGYWKQYADKLFLYQSEWEYASSSELTVLLKKYFEEVTEGKGDLEKFERDLNSKEITQKINFDMGLARHTDIPGTPALYVDGEYIDWTNSEGATVTVNNRTIAWDSAITVDGLTGLLLKIVEAKVTP